MANSIALGGSPSPVTRREQSIQITAVGIRKVSLGIVYTAMYIWYIMELRNTENIVPMI